MSENLFCLILRINNAATFLRKEFGLETARIILGHRSAAITEVYDELKQQKGMEAIVRVG